MRRKREEGMGGKREFEEVERGRVIEGSGVYNPVEIIFANIAMEFSLIIRTVVTFRISRWMRRNIVPVPRA